jgi:hypothetical protein
MGSFEPVRKIPIEKAREPLDIVSEVIFKDLSHRGT